MLAYLNAVCWNVHSIAFVRRGAFTRPRPKPDKRRLVWALMIRAGGSRPRPHSLHSHHRGAAADPGPLIRRASLEILSVNSSILERNSLRIGEVFELL